MVRMAAAQMRVSKDIDENLEKSKDFIRRAAEGGAKLIAFPEGQLGPYAPQYPGLATDDIAVEPDSKYITELQQACADNSIIGLLSHNLLMDGNIYPCMIAVSEQGEILRIQKNTTSSTRRITTSRTTSLRATGNSKPSTHRSGALA